jgi:hypothetical protein
MSKLTLDEAIKHYEGRASDLCKSAKRIDELGGNGASIRKYLEEHRQLAEWLKELKALKEQTDTLDKIRAEIMSLDYIDEDKYEGISIDPQISRDDVLYIIDKYKAESEET